MPKVNKWKEIKELKKKLPKKFTPGPTALGPAGADAVNKRNNNKAENGGLTKWFAEHKEQIKKAKGKGSHVA